MNDKAQTMIDQVREARIEPDFYEHYRMKVLAARHAASEAIIGMLGAEGKKLAAKSERSVRLLTPRQLESDLETMSVAEREDFARRVLR